MRSSLLLACLLAACEHTPPHAAAGPDPLGPREHALPRRLTYSSGDDRHPAVNGAAIVYSRLDPDEQGNERCLATLPVEGGTILAETCPAPPRTLADSFVDTWIEPALSPDGRRIAYMWQQGSLVSVLGFGATRVVVAPLARAGDTSGFVWPIFYVSPSGRPADAVSALSWVDDHTLRFLLGHEYIFKVKGGGLIRYTDTTFQSYGLAQLDLSSGALSLPAGGDSALAYAVAPDGGLWLVRNDSPLILRHLAAGADSATAVAAFSDSVRALAQVAGLPVAVVADTVLEWFLPGDSVPHRMGVGGNLGPARRIAPVAGTRRVVVEIERGWDPFGAPANLWLYELP
jgi:hypothetical protein